MLALIAMLAILGMLPGSLLRVETAHADSPGTLTIVVPNPSSSGTSLGPVGANVTVSGSGFSQSAALQLGVATQDTGCSAGFQALSGLSVNTDSSGGFETTFAWPASLANVGTAYYICAQESSSTVTQSQSTFTVAGAQAPTITDTKPVPGPTPSAGTPTLPATGFYPGSTIEIDGSNFLPGSTSVLAYLSSNQITKQSDLSSAVQLSSAGGQQITSSGGGQVTATVQIPSSVTPGSYFIYLVSTDGQADALPSLVATFRAPISVQTAPAAPTATATPAAPTPTTSTSNTNPGTGTTPDKPEKLIAVFGLGALSVVLFIVGVILLASAASVPRQQG
jgi:hypothetical protein